MIQLQGINVALGGNQILEGLTWTLGDGKRIGLIGPNGAGKTTLLRVIGGYLEPDAGQVARSGSAGYLAQDVQEITSGRSVIEETLTAFDAIEALQDREESLTQALDVPGANQTKILQELEAIHERLAIQEAHSAQARAETVLEGLGFLTDDLTRRNPLRRLSNAGITGTHLASETGCTAS